MLNLIMQNLSNDQPVEFADYQIEILEKLKSSEALKFQEDNRKFIAAYYWDKGEILGFGAQATVFLIKGYVSSPGRLRETAKTHCALKVFNPLPEKTIALIKRECEVLTLLRHKNVLQYYDFKVADKHSMYIYMELMKVIKVLLQFVKITL